MFEIALKLLDKLAENGFEAYVVGGFVRDYILGNNSNDIDICTNARPKDIRAIFKDACLSTDDYGSTVVILKHVRFEITTFRREFSYISHRRPEYVEFIDDLEEDLARRDFVMNTLCIDRNGQIIDLLNGRCDIEEKLIRTVGDSYQKFSEDALRILRAVRFAISLEFRMSDEIIEAIHRTKHLLRDLSYQRKKEELDKIFTNVHVRDGIRLLIDLGLDTELELDNLKNITNFDDLIGIWAQLDVLDLYPFTNNEKELIAGIKEALRLNNLNPRVLYTYGLYVNSIAANIKGISKKTVTSRYNVLPIKCRTDIALNGQEISHILGKKPGPYLKIIFNDLEKKILSSDLENDKDILTSYILSYYQGV